MIEIIAGVWVTSFILSSSLVAWNIFAIRRQLNSRSLARLNQNLAQIQMFWSNASSDFAPLTEGAIELDRSKSLRTAALLGICCFASLPGLLFVAAVVFSMRFLARERKEIAVFHSELAQTTVLDSQMITHLVESLRKII